MFLLSQGIKGLKSGTLKFSTSSALKKVSHIRRKQPKNKISIAPKFIENLREWPKLLTLENEAQFKKLDELIQTKADWRTIEERGFCIGNLIAESKHYEVSTGDIVSFSGNSISRARWLRTGIPVLLHTLDTDGNLKRISDGHIVDVSNFSISICVYNDNEMDFSTRNYILTPSSNSGVLRFFQNILKDPSTLSSNSINLVNLAYRSIPMPSIHDRKPTNLPENLNPSQQAAVSAALNSRRNLLCIQGPPGTGKTRVIAEIVHQLVKKKKKVIVAAPTHVAVSNARNATFDRMTKDITEDVVEKQLCVLNNTKNEFQNHELAPRLADLTNQLGRINKNGKEYRDLAWKCYNMRISIFKSIFSTKRAIFTTLGTSSIQKLPEYNWNADVMLVDEAAQCTEPATWAPVLYLPTCKKLVLVGDQKQLPAVVLSDEASRRNLNISLMEKLSNEFESSNINILLNEQYRMNAKLMHWSNEVFYENQLRANERVANITLGDLCTTLPADHVFNSPIFMIDMAKVGDRSQEATLSHSFKNTDELKIITDYVNRLVCDLGINPKDIAVIAPYYAQIEEIRRFMPFFKVDVNTVDAFQGHEREVVIFCIVRDNTEGSIGFLNETRRLNVAVTRAKRQFVLVGNSRMMQRNEHLRKLYRHLNSAKMVFGPNILDSFNHIGSAGLPPSDKAPECSFS